VHSFCDYGSNGRVGVSWESGDLVVEADFPQGFANLLAQNTSAPSHQEAEGFIAGNGSLIFLVHLPAPVCPMALGCVTFLPSSNPCLWPRAPDSKQPLDHQWHVKRLILVQ